MTKKLAYLRVKLSICLIVLFYSGQLLAAGQVSSGKEIAIKWCSTCHHVTDAQKSTPADIPSFGYIAKKFQDEMDALVAFLYDPHPPMPNLSLSRQEIQDLTTYIESVK